MSTGLIPQTPEPDSYALASFAPSSRAVARATRRRTDAVLGRAEVTHARDQARAVLAAGALNNTAALVGLADPDRSRGCFRRVGDELGVNPETLRGWVRQARIDAGDRPGTTTEGARRIKELEKEVRELRRANAILRSASAFFAAELDRPSR